MLNQINNAEQSMLAKLSGQGDAKIADNWDVEGNNGLQFKDFISDKLAAVNHDQVVAGDMMKAVETGHSDDLVGSIVAAQKASLSFGAMVQVRNRLVQALDEIMKMPL